MPKIEDRGWKIAAVAREILFAILYPLFSVASGYWLLTSEWRSDNGF